MKVFKSGYLLQTKYCITPVLLVMQQEYASVFLLKQETVHLWIQQATWFFLTVINNINTLT